MWKFFQSDKNGTPAIFEDGMQVVTQFTCPPLLPQKNKFFRQYLKTAAGSYDMQVDGSTTNVDFFISASDVNDRYITTVSFEIADVGAKLNEFGAIAALTNGCVFEYHRSGEVVVIHEALKTNWDFVRLSLGTPAFGRTTASFIASNVSGNSEGVIPVVDFARLMPPYGIKLDRGTLQRLTLRVRDNTTGVDSFNAIAYGFERFE